MKEKKSIWKYNGEKTHCRIKYERRNYITTSPQNLSLRKITVHVVFCSLSRCHVHRIQYIHFHMQCIVVCTFIVCSQCVRTANHTKRILTRKFSSESFVFALALCSNVRRIFNQNGKEMEKNVNGICAHLPEKCGCLQIEPVSEQASDMKQMKKKQRGKERLNEITSSVSRRWWEYRKLSWNILIYEYLWKSLCVLLLPSFFSNALQQKYACVPEREWNESFFEEREKEMLESWRQNYQMYNKEADSTKWTKPLPRWGKKNVAQHTNIYECAVMNKIKRFIEMQAKSKLFNKSFFGAVWRFFSAVPRTSHTYIMRHYIQLRELNISPLWKSVSVSCCFFIIRFCLDAPAYFILNYLYMEID